MLGLGRDALLASPLSSLYPDDPERVYSLMREVLDRGAGTTREFDCRTPSGERRSTEISASVVELSSGPFVIALLRDVTDRRRAEERLQIVNARMRADLEAAAEMQRALLPDENRPLRGVRAAWHVEPCERLGGDTLNVFALDHDRLGFFLLDVSGHGVKAAMLSVALHRVLSPFPHPGSVLVEPPRAPRGVPRVVSPRRVASRLNRLFPMDETGGQYFTIVYGVLDVPKRELCFVSAGQGAPLYVPRGGEPQEIERYDLPIGLVADARYDEHCWTLEPGSRLFFFSDGVVEAAGEEGEDFGKGRVLASLRRHRTRALDTTVQELAREVREWSARGLRDDVSVLAIELASR